MPKQEVDINITIDLAPTLAGNSQVKIDSGKERIKVSISVSQLAYLFRGVKTKNVSEVLRFIAENFSTPKAESISFDSLMK